MDVTLFRFIDFHARCTPSAPAVVTARREVPYARFRLDIELATKRLVAHGIADGTIVALAAKRPYYYWVVAIACMRLGIATIHGVLEARPGDSRESLLVTDDGTTSGPCLLVTPEWFSQDAESAAAHIEVPPPQLDRPCRYVKSSGTTGTSKQIAITFGELRQRAINLATLYRFGPDCRWICGVGVNTLAGFQLPVAAWYGGGCIILPAPSLTQAYRNGRPTAGFFPPGVLDQLLQEMGEGQAPANAPTIYVGGATLRDSLNEEVRRRLSPDLVVVYGSTEISTGTMVPARAVMGLPGCVGFVPPFADLQVVDEEDQPVPPGHSGTIRIRAEGMATHYVGDPEATAQAFRDGWFYPGDAGYLDAQGALHVVGRASELANIGGNKVSLERIDETLAGFAGVQDLAAFVVPGSRVDRVWLAVVATEGFDEAALRVHCAEKFATGTPGILVVPKIPRNEMGKIMRTRLRHMVEKAKAERPPEGQSLQ
jgi:acyl-coenzyme A synthetase/AMP-(fatty) acid ligase